MKKISENELESCSKCRSNSPTSLQIEVENLRQKLIDRNITIVQMEAQMTQELPHIYSQGQLASLRATCDNWQDKYERLLEAHKRVQRVNQGLEDKLLRLVDRTESEKLKLSEDVIKLTTALTTAAQAINRLKNENMRYQNDLAIAVQLLQCNSSQYASQKLNNLPFDLHQKIKSHLVTEPPQKPPQPKTEAKVIRVPIPTFPPTAMVYSINKCEEEKSETEEPVDVVSAAIMAAILEEREKERSQRHCPTCSCKLPLDSSKTDSFLKLSNASTQDQKEIAEEENTFLGHTGSFGVSAIDVGTQTIPSYIGESGKVRSTCIYCHSRKPFIDSGGAPDSSSESNESPSITAKAPPIRHCVNKSTKNSIKNEHHQTGTKADNKPLSWDWHAESQDSGSPPTPTSITSASLSYESELSCFASPQESPGHLSLHIVNGYSKNQDAVGVNNVLGDHSKIQVGNLDLNKARKSVHQPINKNFSKNSSSDGHLDKALINLNINTTKRTSFGDNDGFYTTPIHISPPIRQSYMNGNLKTSNSQINQSTNESIKEPNSFNSLDIRPVDRSSGRIDCSAGRNTFGDKPLNKRSMTVHCIDEDGSSKRGGGTSTVISSTFTGSATETSL